MKLSARLLNYLRIVYLVTTSSLSAMGTLFFYLTAKEEIHAAVQETSAALIIRLNPSNAFYQNILEALPTILIALVYATIFALLFIAIRLTTKKTLHTYTGHILLDLQENSLEIAQEAFNHVAAPRLQTIEDQIDKLLQATKPLSPVSGITKEICELPGLYRVQDKIFRNVEKTFAKGNTFPPLEHPKGNKEIKVTWVYQHPSTAPKNEDTPFNQEIATQQQEITTHQDLVTRILILLHQRKKLGVTTIRNTELPPKFTTPEIHKAIQYCIDQQYVEGPTPVPVSDTALLQVTDAGTQELLRRQEAYQDPRPKTL